MKNETRKKFVFQLTLIYFILILTMEYFPTFDDENDEETENNNIVVQNGGNGIIGILSNLFRPSGSSSRVVDIQQQEENRQNENEDSKEFELNSNGITNGGKMRTERQILPPSRSAESEQKLFRYTKSDFRRYWMPDSSGTVCYECNEKFSTFRRRHHCRLCGQIFCKNCANRTLDGTDFGYYGILRLCNYCADQMQIQIQSKNRPKDKIKLFLDNKMNDVSYRDIQINGEIDFISQNTSKEAFQSNFFLQPSSSELGLKHAITINPAGQDASNNLSHPSQEDSKNKNQQLLEQMFEKKMEKIFEGLLLREKLCAKSWKFLMQLSRVVADKITPLNLATSETQNPLDFTHIKKIHIDMEPTYELINGVGFNKSLAHSAMPIFMKNVSLMLLNGTISYERILEKFSSIEPIIQQECQFFRNSCDRVRSAHISLMISEMPVPIAFMDLLIKEGISLITDVKMSVLKRISSATGADILNSLDAQFLQPRVGFVADFSQREFQTFTQQSKRIILMENCADGNFGPTILLKGRNMRELIAAKRILRYLILARYSSILEIAFLSLFNSLPKGQFSNNTLCHICELNQRNSGKDENEMEIENQSETEFMALFKQTQLTNSPAIHFSPPYLETPLGRQCSLLPYFKLPLFHYLVPTDCIKVQEQKEKECARFETLNAEEREKKAENAQMGHRMVDSRMGGKFKKLLNEKAWSNFRSTSALNFRQKFEFNQKAREETLLKLNDLLLESEMETIRLNKWANLDVLDPINHQGIAFLFGANSRKNRQNASEFCVGPFLFYRSFYDKNKDVSLGKFLINFCFNPEYKCSLKGCERPMLDHFRRIVHRNTRIELTTHNVVGTNRNSTPLLGPFGTSSSSALTNASALDGADGIFSLDELPSSIPNNNCQQMICWLRCNSCSANSSIVPMNDAVFHLSFAKFIDYLANGYHFVAPFPSSIDFHQCVHCTFHMHSHFFALGNYVACFRVSPIYPLNVVFSPIPCALGTSQKEDICEIREIQDAKGTHMIDVGSIIAHAFNSEEYSNKIAAVEEAKHNPTILQPDLIEIVHSDEKHHYSVKMHFPEQFKQFRSLIFFDGEKKYIHSLSNASAWFPQGGKSGASFLRTNDERFVLKTLSRFELESIKNYALKYIDYVSLAALEHKLTALCKIYGVYGITYTNKQNGQTVKNEYLVMEYLFYKKDIKQIWDLKGSLRNRLASTKPSNNLNTDSPSSSVLLDENYIQDLWRNQMYLTSHSKAALQQAISSDSDFLAQQGIMDYSLLAGISRGQEDEVIIGIVDYMRTFTIDKKVESLVKTALPLSNSPTVISPESYRDRFLERIKGYFQIAPDQWLFTNEA